ncbi:enoyl-CoA hydratase [Singulisphaera sp. PoT]|uniref:enoyl-CoA hydratase n=1 Tax=Singulisphaera sp. PoT TaxID=3411797 RepID=UPI003BF5402B
MTTSTRIGPPNLEIDNRDGVVTFTLNRPERRNALSRGLIAELKRAIDTVAANASARVVVIGAKGSVFCSGHDLSEMTGRDEAEYRDIFAACSEVMLGLRRLPQPVIARVQGVATAAGCQLVAACDMAVASSEATFATPGVKIGLFCTTPMVPLVRAVPDKAALEMLFTGTPITAERARELGLVNLVVPPMELDEAIREYTTVIKGMSPSAIALGKRAYYDLKGVDEPEAYAQAVEVMTENALHPDAQEGIAAFLQKRRPVWKDR